MYQVKSLRINEPCPGMMGEMSKKTISVTVECTGYEQDKLRHGWDYDSLVPYSISETQSATGCVYLTVPYTADPRALANSIKAEIAKMKKDTDEETLLLGKVRQLGATALNP